MALRSPLHRKLVRKQVEGTRAQNCWRTCVRFFGGPAKPPSEAPTRSRTHHASINPTPLARNNNNAHQNRNLLILRPCFLLCLALTVISFVLSEMAPTFLSRSNNQRIVPIEQCHE